MMINDQHKEGRLALRAYEEMLAMILSGEMKPGTIIQERRLAALLGMSRTPVRDALMMLENDRLLVRHEPRMLQVRHMDVGEYVDNLSIRQLLEPEAARLATGKIAPRLLDELREQILQLTQQGLIADRAQSRMLDEQLHSATALAAGNSQMWQVVQGLRRQTQVFDLKNVPERLEGTCNEHLAIIEAMALRQSEKAAEAMMNHLENVRRSIIDTLQGRY